MINKIKDVTAGSKKMLIFVTVIGVSVVAYSFFSAPDLEVSNSRVTAPPVGTPTIQGSAPVPDAYAKELSRADSQRIEQALNDGRSAIPTIRHMSSEQLLPPIEDDPVIEEAPVISLPEVSAPVIIPQPITPAIPIVQQPTQVRNPEHARELATYINGLRRQYPVAEVIRLSENIVASNEQQTPPAVTAPPSAGDDGIGIPLPMAGTIIYAEMVSRANSDTPGPVLAKILQGDFAGATLIGSFQTARDALVISFDKMSITKLRDGTEVNQTIPISTVAVDTSHIGTALATSVDRHLFQKLAIGFTASFAQGFGDALSRSGTTRIITDNGTSYETFQDLNTQDQLLSAGGKAVSETGNILMEEFGRRPTTVIVESGTAIGILFL